MSRFAQKLGAFFLHAFAEFGQCAWISCPIRTMVGVRFAGLVGLGDLKAMSVLLFY